MDEDVARQLAAVELKGRPFDLGLESGRKHAMTEPGDQSLRVRGVGLFSTAQLSKSSMWSPQVLGTDL